MFFLKDCPLLHPGELFSNIKRPLAVQSVLFNIDPGSSVKLSVGYSMFPGVVQGMGTKRHMKFLEQLLAGEVSCFIYLNAYFINCNSACRLLLPNRNRPWNKY